MKIIIKKPQASNQWKLLKPRLWQKAETNLRFETNTSRRRSEADIAYLSVSLDRTLADPFSNLIISF